MLVRCEIWAKKKKYAQIQLAQRLRYNYYHSSYLCNYYFILRPFVFVASQSHSPSSNLVFGPCRSPTKSCLLLLERHSQHHRRDDNNAFVELRRGADKILLPTVVVVVLLVRRCLVWGIRRSKIDF